MNSVIKIDSQVLDEIITHCNINPNLECGGYLYGFYNTNYDNQIVTINGIYYEKVFGTENTFTFSSLYNLRAKILELDVYKNTKSRLIGCYHSHANYKAEFSEIDRILEKRYASNKACLIYSPIDKELIGDIITFNDIYEARVTVINKDNVERLYYPKMTREPDKILSLKKI